MKYYEGDDRACFKMKRVPAVSRPDLLVAGKIKTPHGPVRRIGRFTVEGRVAGATREGV